MRIERTSEFSKWFNSLDNATQIRIAARFHKIETHEHLGVFKALGQGLCELKWKTGFRVYFIIAYDDKGNLFVALLGGGKNGQSRDIAKAREILECYRSD